MANKKQQISYGKQSIDENDVQAVCSVLRSDWLTQGPKSREFEEALAEYCGAKYCIAVCNGTAALHLSCLALGVDPGDVGLTSPITFMASANCIVYCGAIPVFADIDPETLCLSTGEVEAYCRKHSPPKVVIPVDFAGVPAELPKLKELSDKYGFKVIEDAAHAIGSTYTYQNKEYMCGSCAHTDLAIFSFHPVKTITSGEGGAVLTNDADLAHRVRCLANHGIERNPSRFVSGNTASNLKPQTSSHLPTANSWYHEMQHLGYNYRITDIQSALGLSQLKRLSAFKERRKQIVRCYNEGFQALTEKGMLELPPWPTNTDPCFHLYVLRVLNIEDDLRYKVFTDLQKQGIYPQVHYIPVHLQPYYQKHFEYRSGEFPYAESYYKKVLSLPLYPTLQDDQINYVIDSVRKTLS
ncbi:MAG: UDP-4-amino-4,6-dideoxy-N-acetyl-beta-L-altrosamine transaminase [Deltaproteobacteria bacterium]|nr:UDP-4-amino-4,6-dideoxy-N-acetyl-beta-L-altrosamine transaminase [Deltaproteobacteria bacterium]